MARKTLTDKGVAALKPRSARYAYPDPELAGHYIRVTPNGVRTFAAVARNPQGRQIWTTIGAADAMSIADARDRARGAIQRTRDGLPAVEPKSETFREVAERWLRRVVVPQGHRSRPEIERCLSKYLYPAWADRPFTSLRRSDSANLRDKITDNHGQRQAELCIGIARSISLWFAEDRDDYVSPFTQRRTRGGKRRKSRSRFLNDEELVSVWEEAEASGSFGALVKMLLLTAQRRGAVLGMRWDDLKGDVWEIPLQEREKTNAGALRLPAQALAIITAQPRIEGNPYVFAASRGGGPMNGFSRAKRVFDASCGVSGWTLHDLRRSSRSLMSRAGVLREHAERTLGHALPGLEGIYNQYEFFEEKSDALARLAALIDGIVHPRDNVTPIRKRAKA